MTYRALIKLNLGSHIASVCRESLAQELESVEYARSKIKVYVDGDFLFLKIFARDLTALRASVNTYLRWIILCCEICGRDI